MLGSPELEVNIGCAFGLDSFLNNLPFRDVQDLRLLYFEASREPEWQPDFLALPAVHSLHLTDVSYTHSACLATLIERLMVHTGEDSPPDVALPGLTRLYIQIVGSRRDAHNEMRFKTLLRVCKSRHIVGLRISYLNLKWNTDMHPSEVRELRQYVGTLAWDSVHLTLPHRVE